MWSGFRKRSLTTTTPCFWRLGEDVWAFLKSLEPSLLV
jgi:hypothetical protein